MNETDNEKFQRKSQLVFDLVVDILSDRYFPVHVRGTLFIGRQE